MERECNRSHRFVVLVKAESYANTFVAEKLREMFYNATRSQNVQNLVLHVDHSRVSGHDRLLEPIAKGRVYRSLPPIIYVVDMEAGPSRKYIELNFEIIDSQDNRIKAYRCTRFRHIYALVFDPNIEEAFICKVFRDRCRDEHFMELIKSSKAQSVLESLYRQSIEFRSLLANIFRTMFMQIIRCIVSTNTV